MKLSRKQSLLMGGSILGLLLLVVIGVFIFSHDASAAQAINVSFANGTSTADAAAIRYVNAHYPENRQATVLKTEADHEHGIPVYDVRVLASNGTVYVVHVRQSNAAILTVNRAENQNTSTSNINTGGQTVGTTPIGGSSGADNAALHYVSIHYPGNRQATVLKTEADHEHGIPVYDVRVLAPNGTVYVVHVRQSNAAILTVNRAENQQLKTSGN